MLRIALLGFGHVNRALHALLERRRSDMARDGLATVVSGVASRRIGWRASAGALDPTRPDGPDLGDFDSWLDVARPDVLCEAIALDPHTGQPALDYVRAALARGVHVVSANKGPVVHGVRALGALGARTGARYRFESAVMDGAPLFSLVRRCLPYAGIDGVRGVFTSTATVVLEAVERGGTIADGVAHAQALGIAEADPSFDIDGWDSAVKLCAVANVLLGADLRPPDVSRTGIGALDPAAVRAARDGGTPIRLVGEVARDEAGAVRARVEPVPCDGHDPLGMVRGTSLVTHFRASVFPGGLTITSHDPDPTTTAYGMLADLVDVARLADPPALPPA